MASHNNTDQACKHQHDEECQHDGHTHGHSHAAATAAAQSHSHGHAHSGASSSQPSCDYCSSIRAHAVAVKAQQRREEADRRARQQAGDEEAAAAAADGYESSDDELDIHPAQRVALPIDTRILTAITCGFVMLGVSLLRKIWLARAATGGTP